MQTVLEQKLAEGLVLAHLEVLNESHMHSGPATDSHFKVTAVSSDFEGKRLVQRHQLIYGLLAQELAGPIHALAMHLYTPEEWQARGEAAPLSPKCAGGVGSRG
ncbi:MAG: BolA family protein [Pontibacterium sp.]